MNISTRVLYSFLSQRNMLFCIYVVSLIVSLDTRLRRIISLTTVYITLHTLLKINHYHPNCLTFLFIQAYSILAQSFSLCDFCHLQGSVQLLCQFCSFVNSVREGNVQCFSCLLSHKIITRFCLVNYFRFLCIQRAHIGFQSYSIPSLSCLFPIHPTRYNCSFCYSVSFLSCLFPIHLTRYYCSLCYSVFFLSCFFPIYLTRYYCSLCYSVFFFKLHFSYPFRPLLLFPLLFCLLFSLSIPAHTQSSLLFLLLLCLLLPCPFFTFLSHFLIVAFPCYFSSTKAYFRQVLTLFFCSILFLLSITKLSIYVFICTYFHVII